MSENLLKSLTNMVTPGILSKLSGILGENESDLSKGLSSAAPALLSSLVDKSSNESGAKGILDMIKSNNLDGSMLNNMGDLLGNQDNTSSLMDQGGNILNSLMGNNSSNVFNIISRVSGMSSNSAGGLMKFLAPMLMSMIGKKVFSNNLGASGLMSLLGDQKGFLKGMLPAGMGSALGLSSGFSNLMESGKDAVSGAANTVNREAKQAINKTKKFNFWPLLLGLLILLGLFYFIRGCGDDVVDGVEKAAEKTTEAVGDAAKATKDAVVDAAESTANAVNSIGAFISDATLKALSKLKFTAGSVGENFYNWIKEGGEGEKAFAFAYLNFPTGKATISNDGKQELKEFASILKEVKEIKVEVSGHTDNTGDEAMNLKLSQDRAAAIKAQLVSEGIAANRIVAKGYGSSMPISDNATEQGRKDNRRCEVKVMY